MSCPCGGGQSCIVDRRIMHAWVHEDEVLMIAGLEPRKNCAQDFDEAQLMKLKEWWITHGCPDSVVFSDTDSPES